MNTTDISLRVTRKEAEEVIRWLEDQPEGCSEAGLVREGVLRATRAQEVLESLAGIGVIRRVRRPKKSGGLCAVWALSDVNEPFVPRRRRGRKRRSGDRSGVIA